MGEAAESSRAARERQASGGGHGRPADRGAPARGDARPGSRAYDRGAMCRNIRVLYHFEPPTTDEEIRAAALQYVRKVSGLARPAAADAEVFDRAVEEVADATGRLLGGLRARTAVRTREGEREKARARFARRAAPRPPG